MKQLSLPPVDPAPRPSTSDRRLVLVPRRPGPVRAFDARPGTAGDDLDILIDEVFGPSTDERPGLFDVGLVLGGVALIVWSMLTGEAVLGVVGVCLVVLGIALPARALIRLERSRRVARRERAAVGSGLALDVSDPSVNTLVSSYEALCAAAGLPGIEEGGEAVGAAHAALLEVASLLGGRTPADDAEHAYIDRRTAAMRDVTAQLARRYRVWSRERRETVAAAQGDARHAGAVARAREELEDATGTSAAADLERLSADLQGGDRSHDR